MAEAIGIRLSSVTLENGANHLTVTVNLSEFWKEIQKHEYIYVNVDVKIPIIEQGIKLFMNWQLNQNFIVNEISSEEIQVVLKNDFKETFDSSRQSEASAKFLMYDIMK